MQCLAIGALLLWLFHEPQQTQLIISAAQQSERLGQWQASKGRLANEEERQALLQLQIDEALLLREAQAMNYQQLPVVRNRLLQLADFLKLTPSPRNHDEADEAYHQALTLGLDRSDPVVRRYMVAAARQTLSQSLMLTTIDEVQLREYYQQQKQRFQMPARQRISHIYIGGLHEDSQQRALNLAPALQRDFKQEQLALGDAFHNGQQLPLLSQRQIAKRLGGQFADSLSKLPVNKNRWQGPIASSYGYHWVWIHEQQSTGSRAFTDVAPQLYRELRAEAEAKALSEYLQQRQQEYRIVVAELAPDTQS